MTLGEASATDTEGSRGGGTRCNVADVRFQGRGGVVDEVDGQWGCSECGGDEVGQKK